MPKPILVANWKNHPASPEEAKSLLKELSKKRDIYKKLSLFIAPPLAYFSLISERGSNLIQLASQDIPALPKGTYTGEVTVDILKSFGVKLSIIGHSERRALGETAEVIAEKIKIALKSGIAPLVCFGEKERDTDGEHLETLREEMKKTFSGLTKNDVKKIAIAYEPVWAIGKTAKDAIETSELSETVVFMRKALADLFGRSVAEDVPILYGGSVEPINANSLMRDTGIRGFLVGHASLKAKSFEAIAKGILEK